MEHPHWALVGITRIGATNARRVGWHGTDFFGDGVAVVAQSNRVAIALGHFLTVETRQT